MCVCVSVNEMPLVKMTSVVAWWLGLVARNWKQNKTKERTMHRFHKKIDALRALACAAASVDASPKPELPGELRTAVWPTAFLKTVDAWAQSSPTAARIVAAAIEFEAHSPTPTATPTGVGGGAASEGQQENPIFNNSVAHIPLSQRVQLEERHTYDALDLVRLWLMPLCSLSDPVWSGVWGATGKGAGGGVVVTKDGGGDEDGKEFWIDGREHGVCGPLRETVAWRQFRRACNAAVGAVPAWQKKLPLLRRLLRGGAFAYPPPEDAEMTSELRTAIIRWSAAQRVLQSLRDQFIEEHEAQMHQTFSPSTDGAHEESVDMALRQASTQRQASASAQVAERSLTCTDAWNHVLDVLTRELNEAAAACQQKQLEA